MNEYEVIELSISNEKEVSFHNHVDYCIGTGRMGLALHQEYLDQLKLVQEEIGFQYIRGHGLFCDDMGIYQTYEDENGKMQTEYNFTYLDRVMDSYRKLNLKPFLELGFMPDQLASGEQTVFYWKGNVTPPANYNKWCEMIQATLRHLMERYGASEVVTWPVEVWNEPNLDFFWENADKAEYFKLFEQTFYAVKAVDTRFRIGGPAVCGGSDEEWINAFMDFCNRQKLPLDFVTRHHYTTEPPERVGHYGYVKISDPEDGFTNLKTTRDIIDGFPAYRGLKIHITEFNTSYIPNCPIHDTNFNAAYLAEQLSRLGDGNASYSYWTFGDVFEEQGIPFTLFHGGFGLVAEGNIPKPTFWTFCFFKELQGKCVHRSKNAVIIVKKSGEYCGVAWNIHKENKKHMLLKLQFLNLITDQEYLYLTKTVDEKTCNPLKLWHDLGEPRGLSEDQRMLLRSASTPFIQSERVQTENGQAVCELEVQDNGVVYFELKPSKMIGDLGYDYDRATDYSL